VANEVIGADGKVQRVFLNGKKEVIFANKVRRETYPDGYTIVYFNNGDMKQTYPDQRIVYHFSEAQTTQTTLKEGLQVFKFANRQVEKHHPDGRKEIK
jgi:centromere protein J